ISPWSFDLVKIAERRRANAMTWWELIRDLAGEIDPLRTGLMEGEVPQTFPVLVRRRSRDQIYREMNRQGVGVVSLYHTLVDAIPADEFPESYSVAHQILNLPVHQDIYPEMLERAADMLRRLVDTQARESDWVK
ncbi:MAG: DegT/DnrJ/EryC1/StrS family aminotransferase, partial [Actinomycetota bacterium]|nr:DegT/DnrJ/EryC1/StrS family aminotransferase [Actinomycetota bacterium]